jgi:hypothetical protein
MSLNKIIFREISVLRVLTPNRLRNKGEFYCYSEFGIRYSHRVTSAQSELK